MRYEVWGMTRLVFPASPDREWHDYVYVLFLWDCGTVLDLLIFLIVSDNGLAYRTVWYSTVRYDMCYRHRLVCFIFIGLFKLVFWMHWKLPNSHFRIILLLQFEVEDIFCTPLFRTSTTPASQLNCWTSNVIYHLDLSYDMYPRNNYQTTVHILSITVPVPHPPDGKPI